MRLPRFTLWQLMLVVALIAVNLAAFLFVARPFHENRDLLYLTLGTVPMLDALAITGWLVVTRRDRSSWASSTGERRRSRLTSTATWQRRD